MRTGASVSASHVGCLARKPESKVERVSTDNLNALVSFKRREEILYFT